MQLNIGGYPHSRYWSQRESTLTRVALVSAVPVLHREPMLGT